MGQLAAGQYVHPLLVTSIETQAMLPEVNMTGIGKAVLAATAVRTFANNTKDHSLTAIVAYSELT